jgi:hypothetical protein
MIERQPRAPGIYFGLDEAEYHADPSLGSHDVVRLHSGGPYYWWDSWMNPLRREREESEALLWGSAFHKLILEGHGAFLEAYAPMPRVEDYFGVLRTIDDIKARLRELGLPLSGRKDDLIARLKAADPSAVIWDEIIGKAAEGHTLLKTEIWESILLSAKMITANPSLAQAFTGGYPEVSVFWREIVDGVEVPCKARIDYLRLLETVDLKSIVNQRLRRFRDACRYAIAEYRYDIQCAHYQTAREAGRRFVEQGLVFGPEDKTPPRKWLNAFAKMRPQNEVKDRALGYTWIWVFYQKTGAPIAKGLEFSCLDGAFDMAMQARRTALETYADHLDRFGTEIWVNVEPIELLSGDDLPSWMTA